MPNNHERYVKSYPRYVSSPIWSDDSLFKLFHYCLYKASHNTYKWHDTIIHPGEFPISFRHAADELDWSKSKVQEKLQLLQQSGFVSAFSSKKGTILRISDWESSQGVSASVSTCTENQPTGVPEISPYQNNNINTTHYYTSHLAEPEGFISLWLAYPIDRRTNREEAANLYREAIRNGATLSSMIAALDVEKQSVTWLKESGRLTPGIVKWLQREAWRNYLTQEASEEEEEWITR